MARRPALTPDRIIEAAVQVADRGGLAQLSMRTVAQALGVEAMSLYHHLAGKEALLDALANWPFTRIERPDPQQPWRQAMSRRAASVRRVLARHPWALGLVESRRAPGPALLQHHEAVLACLRHSGFSLALAAHAFSAIDAYVYGFVLTELSLPFGDAASTAGGEEGAGDSAEAFVASIQDRLPAHEYPHLLALIAEQVIGKDYAYGNEFGFGLELVLDGLERHLARQTA